MNIHYKKKIESVFNKDEIIFSKINNSIIDTVEKIIYLLNKGIIRVSEKIDGKWILNEWIKKAILLYFYVKKNKLIETSYNNYYDKIPIKFNNCNDSYFKSINCRIVPPSHIRYGSFIGENTIIMPSFINIGSYIDKGTLIDTWSTIGSCAQIGKNVHISGGVGIGGVLEPIQNNPTIIEDNCFIGARSEIVEGVIVEKNSVISMGVFIGKSTKIYNRKTKKISYSIIPEGSVVIPGSMPSLDKKCNLYCVIIVKEVDEKTRSKIKINELLRMDYL